MTMPLVSIIVPAFNAARWIDRTIDSACAQTHRAVEILVIDDGSTDDTAGIVTGRQRRDERIRLIHQLNGGVARARNRGIDEAQGAFVAPLDSDDLWSPVKIERQLAALNAAGPATALAYNWFRRIDADDRVLPVSPYPVVEGPVFHRHLDWNFISNGSTPLIRSEVARSVRYAPALHDAGNQGCEDYLLQLQIARRHDFVCVPAFLTGYRQAAGSMSAGVARMIRSHLQMYAILLPDVDAPARRIIARRCATLLIELARNGARNGNVAAGLRSTVAAIRHDPLAAGRAVVTELQHARTTYESAPVGAPFPEWEATARDGSWTTRRSPGWLDALERLDTGPADRTITA